MSTLPRGRVDGMLRVVLKAIEDGEVVGRRCSECGKDIRLKPEFNRFLEEK